MVKVIPVTEDLKSWSLVYFVIKEKGKMWQKVKRKSCDIFILLFKKTHAGVLVQLKFDLVLPNHKIMTLNYGEKISRALI